MSCSHTARQCPRAAAFRSPHVRRWRIEFSRGGAAPSEAVSDEGTRVRRAGHALRSRPRRIRGLSDRPMTWGELREVHASGLVDVESHTYESRYLPEWPAPIPLDGVAPDLEAQLRDAALPLLEDLRLAKARLEGQLPGKVVKHLAFPAYDGTSEGIEAAQRCGYEACHWGLLPGRPVNRSGASPLHVARLSHEYLRRLPGDRRDTLVNVALSRARIVRSGWARPSI